VLDDICGQNLSQRLFHYATKGGAESLGFDSGVLAAGRPADFFAIDLDDLSIAGISAADLLSIVVFGLTRTAIKDVIVAGRRILKNGVHELHDEIVGQYKEVYQRVWHA
jgi:formimidoylglutamate deiminase